MHPRSFIKANAPAAQLLCAAVVVLALASFTQRAHASCGYYVVSTHPGSELIGAATPMEHHPAAPADCPCHGPQCGAGQNGATPAVAPPGAGADAFAAIFAGSDPLTEPTATLSISPLQFRCEAHLLPIDPPPRA